MNLHLTGNEADIEDPDGQLLAAIISAQAAFIEESDLPKSFARILEIILKITGSEFGLIGEVFHDETGAPFLRTHSITDISWDDESRRMYEESVSRGLEFRNLNTLFGVTLATCEPVISNNPADDSRSGGTPSGHPPMHSYLGMPIKHAGDMLGMIGIANRQHGYSEDVVEFVLPILNIAGSMASSQRLARESDALREELQSKNTLLEAVVNNIKDSLVIADYAGNIRRVNRAMETLLGFRESELVGRSIASLFSPEDSTAILDEMKKYILTGDRFLVDTRFEIEGRTKGGMALPLDLLVSEIRLGNEKLFVNVIRDISEINLVLNELEKANEKLAALSVTDELTGIGNRRAFELELERSFNRARCNKGQVGLALLDIDFFKAFNDNYGHQKGDECLREVGEAFRSFFKRECEFVARVGGEEFAVIMNHVPGQDCVASLDTFRRKIEKKQMPHSASNHGVVTCSIGFAMNELGVQDAAALYRIADEALYEAKRLGRNRVELAPQLATGNTA